MVHQPLTAQVEAAIKASGLPKTARRPTHLDLGKSSAAASPQPVKEGAVVRMGRREGWARFLAYEARTLPDPGSIEECMGSELKLLTCLGMCVSLMASDNPISANAQDTLQSVSHVCRRPFQVCS